MAMWDGIKRQLRSFIGWEQPENNQLFFRWMDTGNESKAPLTKYNLRPKEPANLTFKSGSRRRDDFGAEEVFDLVTGIFS